VYWAGSNGNIIESIFSNNTAGQNGGAVYWSGANGDLINSTFSNNTAGQNGGAIFWEGGNGNISDSIFDNNTANFDGGAICWVGDDGNLINSTFSNNTAGQNGGAIYWEGGNGNITESIFSYNTAGENGGAIYSDFNVKIMHSYFTDNAATDSGGAIYNCSYEDCTFEANSQPQFYPLRDTPMTITVEVKEDIIVIVTLPSDATGNVTVTGSIIFSTTTAPIINGSCIIPAQVLSSGEYEIRATYDGDESYLANSTAINITVSKTVPDITVKTGNIEYGEAKSIDVSLPGDATGNVEFTLFKDDSQFIESKNLTVSGGTVSYALPMLNVGRYTLKTRYSGDSRYESNVSNTEFYVSPKINITPDVVIDEEGRITMELGNVTGRINVYVDGIEDGSKTIKNGRITYYLSTDELTVGNHSIHFQYSGTDFDENVFNYWNETTGSYQPILYLFCIHKKQSESEAETKGDILEVILEDDKGIVLENATGNIEFTILNQFTGEVTKIVVEIVNGIANLDISRFKDGNYIISWYYAGDDKHAPMSDTMVLEINHKVSRITAGDLSTLYTSSQAYSVRVYGSDGKAISGVPVTFLINNKAFKTVKTDKNGVASVAITQKPGTYKITAKSQAVSVTKKLTVKHILSVKKIKIKRTAKKITIKATLKKVNGKYLKSKKIKFRFNGKKYTAKTNKKGVAKIVINKNVLKKLKKGKKVTYQATYLKDTVKKSVKVK
uniref:Ig-like domain repeat protein n=1 Tax=Methanobrevibacter sp. TaxID=66852 RepID=UPI00386BF244